MSALLAPTNWTDANQQHLVAEFARLRALLGGGDSAAAGAECERLRVLLPAPAAIDHVAHQFGLSEFERDVVLLAAGAEMDAEIAALCSSSGRAHGGASFAIAASCLPGAHWSALAPTRALRRWHLVLLEDDGSLTTSRLRIEERLLHYLAGINYLDPQLQALFRPVLDEPLLAEGHAALGRTLVTRIQSATGPLPRVQLHGADASAQLDIAAYVAAACGLGLYAVAGDELPADAQALQPLLARWERDAVLLESALVVECAGAPQPAVRRFIERCGGLVFVATPEPLALDAPGVRHRVDLPTQTEQSRLWRSALGTAADTFNGDVEGVSAHFRMSARDVARAAASAVIAPGDAPPGPDALWSACREIEHVRMGGLAERIEPMAGWDELVLPESQRELLRQIEVQVRHRMQVHERWGFARRSARGLGVSALFAGESGTGKTMAAEVLARTLHLELFRIDLSAVVSKYIGETEKHLARVFDSAERSGAILLFDEADALFGKRSEVRDSHDRYANIEISYLLQRMEAYRGLAILTSNQKAALDAAFQRRLRFVVNFPFPGAVEREAIWRGVLPADTPRGPLDYPRLARLHASGGQIRNIALVAAFFAAEDGAPVSMAHMLRAAHADAAKRDHGLSEAETRGWV